MFLIDKDQIRSTAFIGKPYLFSNLCSVYPITVEEMLDIGIERYRFLLGLVTMTSENVNSILLKSGIEADIDKEGVLGVLFKSAERDDSFFVDLQDAFSTFLREEVLFSFENQVVMVGEFNEYRTIDSKNFLILQEIIRIQNHMREVSEYENESDIAKKMRLNREKVARIKNKQNKTEAIDFNTSIISLCLREVDVGPLEVGDLPLFALNALTIFSEDKDKYTIDIESLLAGADSKKVNPEYWVKNLK